jgi:hypothetical protein
MRAWRGLVSTSAGLEATPFQSLFGTEGRISRFTFLPVSTPSCARPAIFPVPAVSLGLVGSASTSAKLRKTRMRVAVSSAWTEGRSALSFHTGEHAVLRRPAINTDD